MTNTTHGFRPLRAADGINPAQWTRALASFAKNPPPTATLLKHDGANVVWSAKLLGAPVIIKRRAATGPAERLKQLFRLSRSFRQWRGSELLRAAAISTPRCLFLARDTAAEWLVMEQALGPTLLQLLARKNLSHSHARACSLATGTLITQLAQASLFNRDQKPSNIIITRLDDFAATPAVIDTVGVRNVRQWNDTYTTRMLASLVIEPTGVGIRIPRSTMMRALRRVATDRARRHTLWRTVQQAVHAHGNPTPKINPLHPSTK